MTREETMNMSNEQAVQILIPLRNMMCDQNGCPISDAVFALDMAIEALQAKTDGDTISRQDAIDAIRKSTEKYAGFMEMEQYTDDDAVDVINSLPSAEPKTGRWTWDDKGYFYCDRCGKKPNDQTGVTDFCPNCGADMRGDKHEID